MHQGVSKPRQMRDAGDSPLDAYPINDNDAIPGAPMKLRPAWSNERDRSVSIIAPKKDDSRSAMNPINTQQRALRAKRKLDRLDPETSSTERRRHPLRLGAAFARARLHCAVGTAMAGNA
jgi:hypothetical protein